MKIAIVGYGIEGQASYRHWNAVGNEVVIVDENTLDSTPTDAQTMTGKGTLDELGSFDLIIRSPSIDPKRLPYGDKVWSATNEFFERCPAPIIGVTGTKGKGTTCSLIAAMLRAAGKTVHLVGNIGVACLDVLPRIQPEDIVVFELSSFQLWDLKRSPHVAVVLLIEPDHMDVHEDMEDYVAAKSTIAAFQGENDVLIYNMNNQFSRRVADVSPARKLTYPFDVSEFTDSLRLPGKHNQENASAAIAAVRQFGLSDNEIRAGLESFEGLPHRLERVGEVDGVAYYNDSFSSAPSATVAAIRSFESPEVVIIGGTDKGADFTELKKVLREAHNVKKVLLIGEIRHKLAALLEGVDYDVSDAGSMAEIVEQARSHTKKGDIVILSPACASFDLFKNFYDRGDQFREVVQAL